MEEGREGKNGDKQFVKRIAFHEDDDEVPCMRCSDVICLLPVLVVGATHFLSCINISFMCLYLFQHIWSHTHEMQCGRFKLIKVAIFVCKVSHELWEISENIHIRFKVFAAASQVTALHVFW